MRVVCVMSSWIFGIMNLGMRKFIYAARHVREHYLPILGRRKLRWLVKQIY